MLEKNQNLHNTYHINQPKASDNTINFIFPELINQIDSEPMEKDVFLNKFDFKMYI